MKTESRHPASRRLDALPTLKILELMSRSDAEAARAVRKRLPKLARLADRLAFALERGGRVFFIGAGTSGRLAAAEAAECPPTFGVSPRAFQAVIAGGAKALERAVEGAEDDRQAAARELAKRRVGPRDWVIGVSASGRTPFVLGGLQAAESLGAGHTLITCNPVPGAIDLPTGPEIVSGSTRLKAGTATKMALNMLTTAAMVRRHRVYAGYMVDVLATNSKLLKRAERIVRQVSRASAPKARRALRAARGNPKLAIAMLVGNFDAAAARALLRRHRDSLGAFLGEIRKLKR